MSYYEAGGEVPEAVSEELVQRDPHVVMRKFKVPARVPEELRGHSHAMDDIEIILFSPRPLGGSPRPCVIVSPVLANSMLLVGDFSHSFTRLGYHAAIVVRKDFDVEDDMVIEDAETEFRLLVMRSKQAIDWLEKREEIDGDRLGTFGISAGSVVWACAAGADTRPKAHVLVLAGGPLSDVMIDTTEDRFERYAEEMPGPERSKEEIRADLRRVLKTDPINLASNVKTEDVFMLLARYDTAVPIRNGLMLWDALGRPRMKMMPLGHYTAFLLIAWIQHQANMFLGAKLGPP